jgi:amino acid permease
MNLNKMFIGIALVAFPYSVSWVGFVAAALGIAILAVISLCSSYLLFKARNRFKSQTIVDLADLGYACYGEKMRLFCQVILVVA